MNFCSALELPGAEQTVMFMTKDAKPIGTRGGMLTGTVVSDKMKKTVVIERDSTKYYSKYKKYARSRSRIVAHNPENINAKVGDMVAIAETRKLSKTKAWTVVEIIKPGETA
jgi:small subunit ribosomal protein S17